MTEKRAIELLQGVVEYVSIGNSISGQIEELESIGFTREDLLYFGYSETDIDDD